MFIDYIRRSTRGESLITMDSYAKNILLAFKQFMVKLQIDWLIYQAQMDPRNSIV